MKKNTAKQPLAERFHPLLPISIQVYEQQDPPCPLLAGFFGNLCYESHGEDGFIFPPHENIGPYNDMEAVIKNRTAPENQVYAFEVKANPWDDPTKCAFWINRYEAERDLPDTGRGWRVNALVYFVTLAEVVKRWAADESCYELQLVVNGNTVKCLGGFWAADEDEALEIAPANWMEAYAPTVWDVIPDTFSWSARLKRAMKGLSEHADDIEAIEAQLSSFGYGIDDVPTSENLAMLAGGMPDEDSPIGNLCSNFVRAWHIARSVLSFDWKNATERTILTNRWWFSLEPSAEYNAPQLTDQSPISGALAMPEAVSVGGLNATVFVKG
jgi:hypothetical protein